MRITDSMMATSYLRNLRTNQENVQKINNQLSSMKEVSKPSDDPMRVSQIMDLNDSIIQNEQYHTTIEDALDWTDMQDSALAGATNSMSRIGTLVQQAANGTMNASDRQAIKAEVEAEIHTLVDALNTNFGGRYVFSGTDTKTQPFSVDKDNDGNVIGVSYHGTEEKLSREIAPEVKVDLNTNGKQLLGNGLSTFLADVVKALDENDAEALSGELAGKASQQVDTIVNMRTEIGAIANRMDAAKLRNEDQQLSLEAMRSDKEDIDFAQKYMEFTMEQVAYQASLSMGTKILQTNILDYL